MITRVQLPSNAELMPAMPPAPAHLVAGVEQAEAKLNAVRSKRRDYELSSNDRARSEFYNELRAAIGERSRAVIALAEFKRRQAQQLLAELRTDLPALEVAWTEADIALRSQQRRIELVAQIAQTARAEIEESERSARMVAPAQPSSGDSQRIHVGQGLTAGMSLWT